MQEARELFGRKIKQLRRAKNLTQAELAESISLSVNYISQIETGVASPTFETIVKLAEGLQVELKDLFDFSSNSNHPK
jgi:transcriptional regulator with XRE-family HTH domain